MMTAQTTESQPAAWKPGDEKHRIVYERVLAGDSWKSACENVGVSFAAAQFMYRKRGFPSPRRTNIEPVGGRDAAAERAYSRALAGEVAAVVSRAEGIGYQYLRRWCAKNGRVAPRTSLRTVEAEIKAMFGTAA